MADKKIQGKKNRQSGVRFELKVRKDLEKDGWFVSKFMNNVDIGNNTLIPAKHRFRGKGIPMVIGTGFPDFICFRPLLNKFSKYKSEIALVEIGRQNLINDMENEVKEIYDVVGVEVKSNGYLTREEKEKCNWLLNNVFSKIIIAKKGIRRGEIIYKEVKK
jgi:hypothetical protein